MKKVNIKTQVVVKKDNIKTRVVMIALLITSTNTRWPHT